MYAAPAVLISEAAQEFKRVDIEGLIIGHSQTGRLCGPGHCSSSSKFFHVGHAPAGLPLVDLAEPNLT